MRDDGSTTRRELMALMAGSAAGVALGGNARAQGTPKRGGILRISAPATIRRASTPRPAGRVPITRFCSRSYDTLTEWDFETLKPEARPGRELEVLATRPRLC